MSKFHNKIIVHLLLGFLLSMMFVSVAYADDVECHFSGQLWRYVNGHLTQGIHMRTIRLRDMTFKATLTRDQFEISANGEVLFRDDIYRSFDPDKSTSFENRDAIINGHRVKASDAGESYHRERGYEEVGFKISVFLPRSLCKSDGWKIED